MAIAPERTAQSHPSRPGALPREPAHRSPFWRRVLRAGWCVVCGLALVWVLLTIGMDSARSQSLPELRQQQEQLKQQRQTLQEQQKATEQQQKTTEQTVKTLQQSLKQTEQAADRTQSQLDAAIDQLGVLERDVALAEQTYQRKRLAVVARLRFLQQQSKQWGLAALLQSKSLEQFFDRQHRLQAVYAADRSRLRDLDRAADQLSLQRSQWQERRRELASLSQDLSVDELELRQKTKAERDRAAALQADQARLQTDQAQLDRDSANLTRLIQQRITEQQQAEAIARLNRMAALRIPGQFGVPNASEPKILKLPGGILATPVEALITSGFGWRVHPILGYGRQHNGIDFGASYGTTVRSAHTGTVVVAGSFGGYGN
ncbi:MAG TPA: hypothetical protein V6D46_09535, partial [Coleofasciculaceae cyanobacterium]